MFRCPVSYNKHSSSFSILISCKQYRQADSPHHLALKRLHRQDIYSLYPLRLINILNRASLYHQECETLHHQAAVPIPHPRIHLLIHLCSYSLYKYFYSAYANKCPRTGHYRSLIEHFVSNSPQKCPIVFNKVFDK